MKLLERLKKVKGIKLLVGIPGVSWFLALGHTVGHHSGADETLWHSDALVMLLLFWGSIYAMIFLIEFVFSLFKKDEDVGRDDQYKIINETLRVIVKQAKEEKHNEQDNTRK